MVPFASSCVSLCAAFVFACLYWRSNTFCLGRIDNVRQGEAMMKESLSRVSAKFDRWIVIVSYDAN